MEYNILAYLIYGAISYWITVKVGWICYNNGIHFIRQELQDQALAESVNRLLLAGYYLVNLGYITLMVCFWEQINNYVALIESLCEKLAMIVLILALLHYTNITVIYLVRKNNVNS